MDAQGLEFDELKSLRPDGIESGMIVNMSGSDSMGPKGLPIHRRSLLSQWFYSSKPGLPENGIKRGFGEQTDHADRCVPLLHCWTLLMA